MDMTSRTPNTPASAPRPTFAQTTGARLSLHAQNRPAAHALYGAGIAGLVGALLTGLAAAPGLATPGGPVWLLAAIPFAGILTALVAGAAVYLSARNLPAVATSRPEVYAAARLQAGTGLLGPDPETNRAARQMSDHLVRANSPGYMIMPLAAVTGVVSVPALTGIAGPGFEPLMLTQLTPMALLVGAGVAVYFYARDRQGRFERFRAEYDRHAEGPAPTV